jgi:enolase
LKVESYLSFPSFVIVMKVKEVEAYIVRNSRGEKTVEVKVNKKYVAAAPSGASTGSAEVKCYVGSIESAVNKLNKFSELKGMRFEEFDDLEIFDSKITEWGGNVVVALQFALLKAMSDNSVWNYLNDKAKNLPTPLGNCIGGGKHTRKKGVDVQEFLLIPTGDTFEERMTVNDYVYRKLGKALGTKERTDEGAYMPAMNDTDVFDYLHKFLQNKENSLGMDVSFGVDMASSSYFDGKFYSYNNFSSTYPVKKFTRDDHVDYVNKLIRDYKLSYVEDGMQENDYLGFSMLNQKTMVCGDDLVATNLDRLKEALKVNAINTLIVKPNQIGSVVKAKEVVDYAHKKGIKTVISHRSGETMDATISHLAVAWNMPYIKTGIYGAERRVKLKELLNIEKKI